MVKLCPNGQVSTVIFHTPLNTKKLINDPVNHTSRRQPAGAEEPEIMMGKSQDHREDISRL